jgi:hypothetical protein
MRNKKARLFGNLANIFFLIDNRERLYIKKPICLALAIVWMWI